MESRYVANTCTHALSSIASMICDVDVVMLSGNCLSRFDRINPEISNDADPDALGNLLNVYDADAGTDAELPFHTLTSSKYSKSAFPLFAE